MALVFRYGDPREINPAAPPCPGCGEPLELIEVYVSENGLDEIWDCIADPDCLNALRLTWTPESPEPRVTREPVNAE